MKTLPPVIERMLQTRNSTQSLSLNIRRPSSLALVLVALLGLVMTECTRPATEAPSEAAIRHNNLGVALMDAGSGDPGYFEEAVREFEEAVKQSPNYNTARINLGIALYYAGKKERSSKTLEAIGAQQPDNAYVNYMLGLLRENDARYKEAAELFRTVVERDAGDPDSWYHLGFCLVKLGRYDESIEPLARAAAMVPYQRAFRYNLFMALSRAGRTAEAQAEFDNFKNLEASSIQVVEAPKSPQEYLKLGRYAEAIADPVDTTPKIERPARYLDLALATGLSFRHAGSPADDLVGAALRGEPLPRSWFADPSNRRRLAASVGCGASISDFNNDNRLDVFLVNVDGKHALFQQGADGKYENVTSKVGIGPEPTIAMASCAGDYDNDGWVDLLITGYGGIRLYRNRQGLFENVTGTTGIARSIKPAGWYMGSAFADVDHDGDLDIYVTGFVDLSKLPQLPELRFPEDFSPQSDLLLRNNRDGTFTETGRQAGVGVGSCGVWSSDANQDRAIDFVLFNYGGQAATFLSDKDGTFSRSSLVVPGLPNRPVLGEGRAYGDLNGDGAVDQVINRNGASAVLNYNQEVPTNWLTVRLEGHAVPGQVKSNKTGIGALVEVRSLGRWERSELRAGNGGLGSDAPEVYVDLGAHSSADFVRAVFPSGVRSTARAVESRRAIKISEPLLDVSSCPALFAWNGERFEFVTDTISAGILGELVAPGKYWEPDPDEWVRLSEQQLRPDGDRLDIRFVNPLEEVTYLDRARLIAVDHPAGVEVYPNERMVSNPANRQTISAFALARIRPIARALDQQGNDVTSVLGRIDRRYFENFAPQVFKGFAGEWSLTLDLGEMERDTRPILLIHGWSYWNSSASVLGAAQAGWKLWGPVLEVEDLRGNWRNGIGDMGVSAGLPRTIVVDLSAVLKPGEQRIRIRSNRTLYYDQIAVANKVDEVELREQLSGSALISVTEQPLVSAELRWLGYPKRKLPGGRLPEVYAYDEIDQEADWSTHAGWLTRYGDVRELAAVTDERFVVMGHGEEISLCFGQGRSPSASAGLKRTYLFYSCGYEKSYDLFATDRETVGPLPFSLRGGRSPTNDRVRYLVDWNTRPSFSRR